MRTIFRKFSIALFFGVFSILAVDAYAKELKRLANDATVSSLEIEEAEPALEIEEWMVDDTLWGASMEQTNELIDDIEPAMEIENWMTNDSLWKLKDTDNWDIEEDMVIEKWMTEIPLK